MRNYKKDMNDYLSVKEFSAAAGVSTQTIYKQLEKRLSPYVKESGGRKYISRTALEEFYESQPDATEELQKDNPEPTATQPDATELQPDTTEELPIMQPEKQPENHLEERQAQQAAPIQTNNQRELDLLQELIKTIQKELEEKNKQLEIKDKQIQDLSDRLAEAMQLTRGQQYIAAADKTKDLIETGASAEELDNTEPSNPEYSEPPQKKKGFFARLLGW